MSSCFGSKWFGTIGLTLLTFCVVKGQSTFDPPLAPVEIRVDKATEKISIDGVLDEASWKNAKPLYRI
jgi:hypothetical protein